MATSAITLDGFPLIGTTPGGGRAKVTSFDGWLTGSNDRTRAKRTSGHGSWSSRGRRSENPIVARGEIVYPTAAAAAAERRALMALGGYAGTQLVVTDADDTLAVTVEVDDSDVPPVYDAMVYFTFRLTATDPFVRGLTPVTVAVAAGATVPHTAGGTVPAEIEVTLTSAGTVDLTLNGQRLRTGSLPSGAVLTSGPGFTNPKRTIRSSTGANLFNQVIQPMQWPAMVPGSNSPHQAGTANLSIKHYPTYA